MLFYLDNWESTDPNAPDRREERRDRMTARGPFGNGRRQPLMLRPVRPARSRIRIGRSAGSTRTTVAS